MSAIRDLDAAYDNVSAVGNAGDYIARWTREAAAYRETAPFETRRYGEDPRQIVDLFAPSGPSAGLVVFVHGGYWRRFDGAMFSHFAAGCAARGWTVATPSYRLAPSVRLTEIAADIGRAVQSAAHSIEGPIRLSGHSAGGHLVARVVAEPAPMAAEIRARVDRVLSISGLHDLRPLLRTAMNDDLRLDGEEAAAQSPALLAPGLRGAVRAHIGGDELPAFDAQAYALAEAWGADRVALSAAAGANHFDVIEPLKDPGSDLVAWLTAPPEAAAAASPAAQPTA